MVSPILLVLLVYFTNTSTKLAGWTRRQSASGRQKETPMKTIRNRLIPLIVLVLTLAACGAVKCKKSEDCPENYICTSQGTCEEEIPLFIK